MRLKLKILISVSIILLTLRVTAFPTAFAETITYTYDNLNRVTKADYGNGKTITYTYDAAGNRLNKAIVTLTPSPVPTLIVTPTPIPTVMATPTVVPTQPPTPSVIVTPKPSPTPTATPTSIPIGLEFHYTFDEGSGTVAHDSASSNDGTINGAIWMAGKIGGVLGFDGNDYVQIPGLLGQPKNITLSAWVQLNAKDTLGAEVISLGDHVAIRLDNSNGANGFYYDGTTWRGTATGVSYTGTGWHHFVYVIDDTNNIQKVYVDGVEKSSTLYTQSISYTGLGSHTFIGRHANGSSNYDFNGIIDDVRVYNKALNALEVLELYNQFAGQLTTPYASSGIAIDGNLNESSWDIATDVSNVVIGTANNTVKFGVLWDSTYLYVGMTVLDDTLHNDSTYAHEDDSVEIYIDGDHNHGTTYDSYDRQFIKGWNDSTLFEQHGETTGVLHGWAPISGGYSIELAIPWSNLGITPTTGMTLGFSVGYNDDDNGEGREGQAVWIGTANNWLDTSALGDIVLGEAPLPTPTPPPTPTPLPGGLKVFYSFNEGGGTIANDSSGNGNHGTINGAAWATGISGGALSLDGVNDYIDLGNPANLQPGTVSLSIWFKTTATGGRIIRKRTYGYGLDVLPTGKISFWINNAAAARFTATSPNAYNDNRWHHAVGVYSGSLVKLYMDGFQVAAANAGTIFYGAGAIAIGRDGDYHGSYFKGLVDDVRIFQSELSAQAVLDLYDQSSGLVSQWKFDEGIGTVANDWVDGNNGTINGATWTTGKSGSALSLDGNDSVQIPGLLGQPQNITLSAWVQLNVKDTSGAEVISLGDHVAIRLDSSNGAKGFYYDGTTWRGTDTGVSYAGTGWHHVVYVIDDTNNIQKVYVDGVEKGSTAYTQSISYTGLGSNTFIGRHGNSGGNCDFSGIIDDVSIYNKALSAQEVQGLYNNVSALVATASHGFVGMNNGDTYTTVTPPGTATPMHPTTVILHSFKAGADDDRVILTWETSGETDNAGFNIYRSRRRNGIYAQVNNEPINAQGNTVSGAWYSLVDIPPRRGTYYYKLEAIGNNGVTIVHSPVKARMRSGKNAVYRH